MGCNCNKTHNISMGCCVPTLGPIENYYTKYEVDKIIEDIEISGVCCITEDEVDAKIESAKTEIEGEIPSLSGYATEQWVEDKHYITGVDLSDYTTTAETGALINVVTAHTADTLIHVSAEQVATWNAKSDFSGSYNDLTDKPTIPTVPTSNTAFTNDAGYLTEHQSLSAYSTTAEVTQAINSATSGKVETSSIVTVITSSSTDAQIPSAKAVYNSIGDIETLLSQI